MDEHMSRWLVLSCSGIPAVLCVQAMCTAWIASSRESSSAAVLLSKTWEDCTSLVGFAWVQDRCLLVSNWPCKALDVILDLFFFSVSLRDKEINYFNSAEDVKSCCSSWKKWTFAFFVKVTRFLNNMYFKIIVHPWEFNSCFCAK